MSGVAPNNDVLNWGRVSRLIGGVARLFDGNAVIGRYGPYGEVVTIQATAKQHMLSDEGTYYITRTPTPGTGVASITTPTAFVATSPYIIITNQNPPTGRNVWLDYIHLQMVTPGTSSTDLQFATVIDVVPRYTSGGAGGAGTNVASILQGPVGTNTGSPNNSGALVYAGALVAIAASQPRVMCNRYLRTAIAVARDTYTINFGSGDMASDNTLVSGAAIVQRSVPHPPVCIPPGGTFQFHLYGTASAAATTCEVEIGHVER
jgi:hypothetical protein